MVQNTGSVNLSLVVWLLSGLYSMVGAYCYAELGCMIKRAGADYAYIMVTFGSFLAFVRCGLSGNCAKICVVDIAACCNVIYGPPLCRLWVECMIVRPCSQAIVALTFSIYASKPFFPECDPPDEAVRYR